MDDYFDNLRFLVDKKENELTSDSDIKKLNIIKDLLKNNNCFFEIDANTAINILYFLGIPESEIKDYYFGLLNPKSYIENNKINIGIDLKP